MRQLNGMEIKQCVFDILCSFSEFCDKNDLRYYLCGGTLLGAIRHKGFIPWDDDVDVLMPRPDFDRLHVLLKEENIQSYYKLIGIQNENSFLPFAKIVDTRTHVENEYSTFDENLWIDIFPMDGLPENQNQSDRILRKAMLLKKCVSLSVAKLGKGKSIFRKIGKIPFAIFMHLYSPSKIGKRLVELSQRYDFNESEYIGGIAWSLGSCERMKKSEYLPYYEVEFCGKYFHAPACWDYYLTQLYGNYMILPPENQRINHELIAYIVE